MEAIEAYASIGNVEGFEDDAFVRREHTDSAGVTTDIQAYDVAGRVGVGNRRRVWCVCHPFCSKLHPESGAGTRNPTGHGACELMLDRESAQIPKPWSSTNKPH